jgi:DNA-binding NarL/FixJ family response regulator
MNIIKVDRQTIKVLIVDDQKIIRQMLQSYLATETDMEILGFAENGAIALTQIAELHPDIAIIDLEMPDIDGTTTIRIMRERFPQTKALVFSSHDEREYINNAIVAGAKGYLLKGTSSQDIVNAVRRVDRGYFHLGTGLLDKLSTSTENQQIIAEPKTPKIDLEPSLENEDDDRLVDRIEEKFAPKLPQVIDLELIKIQIELIDRLESDLHNLKIKQTTTNANLQKLQQKFYWLLASQIILFLIAIRF